MLRKKLSLSVGLVAFLGAVSSFSHKTEREVQMAVPPLDEEELRQEAQEVGEGTITEIRRLKEQDLLDRRRIVTYEATLLIEGSSPSEEIVFQCRKIRLPGNMTGDTGQKYLPQVGDKVKVFLRTTKEGLEALEPNGIWKLK